VTLLHLWTITSEKISFALLSDPFLICTLHQYGKKIYLTCPLSAVISAVLGGRTKFAKLGEFDRETRAQLRSIQANEVDSNFKIQAYALILLRKEGYP
jgi:hypothetical protein